VVAAQWQVVSQFRRACIVLIRVKLAVQLRFIASSFDDSKTTQLSNSLACMRFPDALRVQDIFSRDIASRVNFKQRFK
jgi:hypothetical protein